MVNIVKLIKMIIPGATWVDNSLLSSLFADVSFFAEM